MEPSVSSLEMGNLDVEEPVSTHLFNEGSPVADVVLVLSKMHLRNSNRDPRALRIHGSNL